MTDFAEFVAFTVGCIVARIVAIIVGLTVERDVDFAVAMCVGFEFL